jgi:hypothetical protein
MKTVIFIAVMLMGNVFSFAQNVVYDENAEVRTVPSFNSIEVSGTISLYLSQGSSQGVAVSAGEEKYNNKIKTEVKNGVLEISTDGGVWNGFNWGNRKLKAYVTVTDLKQLEASGASYITTSGLIKADGLKLGVSGASEVKGMFNVDNLKLDISGASIVSLSGNAKKASLNASGASKISGYEMAVEQCHASSSGASNIRITVSGEINADASGGSNIYYKGGGVGKTLNASAGASIKNRGGSDD